MSAKRDANGRNGLLTLSLRPSGIFGAHDHTMLEVMMRQNMYVFLINFLLDFVYVDNVVHAHLLAERALRCRGAAVGGEAVCITNEAPMRNNPFRRMIAHYGNIRHLIHGPPRLFSALAHALQICRLVLRHRMPRLGDLEYLTPCTWALMSMDIQVDPTKVQRLLDYHPVFTVEEGVQLAVREYQQNRPAIFS